MVEHATRSLIDPSDDGGRRPGVAGSFRPVVPLATESEADRRDKRPMVFGDPLDLACKPSLPKPAAFIRMTEEDGNLRLEERKLFNVLLAESWERLADPMAPGPFAAPAVWLRRAIGQRTQRGNARLGESLERLLTARVRLSPAMANGDIGAISGTLLSHGAVLLGHESVTWDFDPAFRPYLARPGQWARLDLHVCARLRSPYALILYEHLSLLANREFPMETRTVAELRVTLGALASYRYWSDFEQKVIRPALQEINRVSELCIQARPLFARFGRRVDRVRFVVHRKARGSDPSAPDASRV